MLQVISEADSREPKLISYNIFSGNSQSFYKKIPPVFSGEVLVFIAFQPPTSLVLKRNNGKLNVADIDNYRFHLYTVNIIL
jgi:hypothetical protein